MNSRFNPEWLRIARQARLLSQSSLARASNLSQAHLSKIENGLLDPTQDVASRLSSALNFPIDFFYGEDRVVGLPVSVHPMYRKKASVGKSRTDQVEAEINIRLLHLRRLLKSIDFEPELKLPKLDLDKFAMGPEDAARMTRRVWGIPSGPLKDLVHVAERAGCIVMHSDFDGEAVDGLTVQAHGLPPCILLNRNQPGDRQRFTLAHELGHLVMHDLPSPDMENEANAFASELLMPSADIKQAFVGGVTIQRLAELKPVWHVSMGAMLYRAKTSGVITENQSSYLWRQMSSFGYRRAEPPELAIEVEMPGVIHELFRAHVEELGYEMDELVKILCMHEDEVRSMYALPGYANKKTTLHIVK